MSASCCQQVLDPQRGNETYRRVLWVVLAINAAMFAIEVTAGLAGVTLSSELAGAAPPTQLVSSSRLISLSGLCSLSGFRGIANLSPSSST
jgi:hypothetical protein